MRFRLFLALLVVAFIPWGVGAQQDTENKPTPLQARMYRSLTASITPQGIYRHMKALSAYDSRVAGYPGADAAAAYIEQQFREIGLKPVFNGKFAETFDVTVPVDEGATLTVQGSNMKPIRLYSLWPNGVRTCQLPEEGLTLPLIYGGSGAIGELNGQDINGSAVLYDFNCGSQWLNGPRLGAKAILFIEPDDTMRGEAEAKFLTVPLNMPRFWVSRKDAPGLIALCRSSKPPTITLHADMSWQVRKATNLIGKIDGKNPKLKDQVIIVEAFYDSMSVVPALAPGAEASGGIAALLELARTFMQPEHRPDRTVWFIASSAHYLGLKGMRQFLEMHWNELEQNTTRQNIKEWLHAKMPSLFRWQPRRVPQIYEFIGLDLASQSKCVGVFYKGWYYDFREDLQSRYSDIARVHRENAEKVAQVLNLNIGERFADGVNPISGKSWRNFIPAKPAYDAEVIALAGGRGITFSTTDDARMTVDTPLDTLDRVNFANLAEQTRLIACLLWHTFVDPNGIGISEGTHLPITEPAAFGRLKLQGGFARITGRVLAFNPRKSIVPNEPIEDSIAVLHSGSKSFMGVRGDRFEMV
ncbi:MAG: M28 family peptidase, partial [Armatimonadota bacterium]